MFIVVIKPKGALNLDTQFVGPFAQEWQADEALGNMPAAIECDHKYVQQLQAEFWAEEFTAAKGGAAVD